MPDEPFDYGETRPDGQYERHPTVDPTGKKFVRPIRRSYYHLKCKGITTMGYAIAETYALNPSFYGATFCATCKTYFPVGPKGTFVWLDENNQPTDQKVGT